MALIACARPRSPRTATAWPTRPSRTSSSDASRRRPAPGSRSAARSRSRSSRSRSIHSPCGRWNSTPSSHSKRCMPNCGWTRCSFAGTSSSEQRITSVELRRNTSRPPGRSSRAASGIQRYGSTQIDAPYSETHEVGARVRKTGHRRRRPRSAGTRSRSRAIIRRAVASWAGVMSTPTGRAPRFASHAEKYAVPQPSSTTSRPLTSPRTFSSVSSIPQIPHEISSSAQLPVGVLVGVVGVRLGPERCVLRSVGERSSPGYRRVHPGTRSRSRAPPTRASRSRARGCSASRARTRRGGCRDRRPRGSSRRSSGGRWRSRLRPRGRRPASGPR